MRQTALRSTGFLEARRRLTPGGLLVGSRNRAKDRLGEHGDIVRLPRGDDVAVFHDRLVNVEAAGVLDVDGDRRPAGHRAAAQGVHRDEQLRAVADGRDRFPRADHVAHEIDHGVAHAHPIGRVAAGDDDRVEFARTRLPAASVAVTWPPRRPV